MEMRQIQEYEKNKEKEGTRELEQLLTMTVLTSGDKKE